MKKWIALIILVVLAVIIYQYVYQEHRDINTEKAEYILTSLEISNEFSINPSAAEKKYLDKTVEVSGIISEINQNDLTLDGSVFCSFSNQIDTSLKINTEIKTKGRFIGYDDLLEQVKLDQCNITN